MDLRFAMLADHVTETKEGKLVIVGEFDTIMSQSAPANHPTLFIVARFEATVSEGVAHKLRIVFVDADGANAMPPSPDLDINFVAQGPGRSLRANVIINFPVLTLPKFGNYEFHLLIDGHHKATIPVALRKLGK